MNLLLLGLIHELAVYEREPDQVKTTPEQLATALFGPAPVAEAVLAEVERWKWRDLRCSLPTSPTWVGRPGLYLEDLFVKGIPARLRGGQGAVAAFWPVLRGERNYGRMEWSVAGLESTWQSTFTGRWAGPAWTNGR